jgi:hypothetical protein
MWDSALRFSRNSRTEHVMSRCCFCLGHTRTSHKSTRESFLRNGEAKHSSPDRGIFSSSTLKLLMRHPDFVLRKGRAEHGSAIRAIFISNTRAFRYSRTWRFSRNSKAKHWSATVWIFVCSTPELVIKMRCGDF